MSMPSSLLKRMRLHIARLEPLNPLPNRHRLRLRIRLTIQIPRKLLTRQQRTHFSSFRLRPVKSRRIRIDFQGNPLLMGSSF